MSSPSNSIQKLRRGDLILILSILLIACVALLIWSFGREEGSTVSVLIDGQVVASYPLGEDRVEVIHSKDGGENRLVIRDGRAYIESANCPNQDCTHRRPISYVGDSITCLPHAVVIRIDGESDGPDIII